MNSTIHRVHVKFCLVRYCYCSTATAKGRLSILTCFRFLKYKTKSCVHRLFILHVVGTLLQTVVDYIIVGDIIKLYNLKSRYFYNLYVRNILKNRLGFDIQQTTNSPLFMSSSI